MPLAPATRLGVYEILAPLGAGGMGEVYRARDTRLGREIALKVLPAEVSSDASRLARFKREARAVAALNHPNIVVLHSLEEEDGVHFLTMELVEGDPLDRHVTPAGLPIARVVELGIALADALTAAHEKGVIHRDLKPANVVLTRDGRAKVLDFGLAKLAQELPGTGASRAATVAPAAPISIDGDVVGTAPYMAPEQIRGETTDARTDLFALGVVLYELAAGRRPFAGVNAADVSASILRDPPGPLSRARAGVPAELERIVGRCLEKNARERFQTALEVANDLRALRRSLDPAERGAPNAAAGKQVASIAVLPFANRSANADDEYFSDGLADELLDVLAKLRGLSVAARTSAFYFKGKDKTIAEIGSALNVATILEGSVRKAGNRVRISVQLVNVADGYRMWSETYDRTLDDIFAVQDDIAHAVVKELRSTLLGEAPDSDASGEARSEIAQAAKGRTSDPEAHRLYLLARFLLDSGLHKENERAIATLEQALVLDPGFALAWAELSAAYSRQADWGAAPPEEAYPRSKAAAARALALEPELAEGYAALAWIQQNYDWDWRAAEESCARGLELAPGNARLLQRASALARIRGELDQSVALARRGVELDPLSGFAQQNLGTAFDVAGRFAEAEASFRRALELHPQRSISRALLAFSLMFQGRTDEALVEAMQEPDAVFRPWSLGIVHHVLGHAAESDAALQEITTHFASDSAYQIAEVHAMRGEADAAFEWLERAYAQRDAGLAGTRTSMRLRSLHGDSRWGALLRKMGIEV